MKNSQSLNIPSSINSFMNSQTNDNKIGSKTKLLWQNPEYRKHMSEVHKGQKAWNKGIPYKEIIDNITNEQRKRKISNKLKILYKLGIRKSKKGLTLDIEKRIKISIGLKKAYRTGKRKVISYSRTSERRLVYGTLQYQEWIKSVFKRDNYTCQDCGKIGCELNAHHIKEWSKYPELRFDINNGETLCIDCHNKTKGYKNRK